MPPPRRGAHLSSWRKRPSAASEAAATACPLCRLRSWPRSALAVRGRSPTVGRGESCIAQEPPRKAAGPYFSWRESCGVARRLKSPLATLAEAPAAFLSLTFSPAILAQPLLLRHLRPTPCCSPPLRRPLRAPCRTLRRRAPLRRSRVRSWSHCSGTRGALRSSTRSCHPDRTSRVPSRTRGFSCVRPRQPAAACRH